MRRSLTITFCGRPNVGKSTLMNTLMDCKVAICSPKPQTTRENVRGILTQGDCQLVFVDTPGIFRPKLSQLEHQIVKEAWQGFCGTDLICLIVDGSDGFDSSAKSILEKTKQSGVPVIGVINKSDLIDIDRKILLADEMWKTGRFKEIFSLSAKKNKGCEQLLQYFFDNAPAREWMFLEDDISDKDNNFFASEFVREQLFNMLQQELPYMLSCETEMFKETADSIEISVLVKVGKSNHKKMILGHSGSNLKRIIRNASRNLEELFQKPVRLKIFVRNEKK